MRSGSRPGSGSLARESFYGQELKPEEFRQQNPDYVIAFTEQPQLMMQIGIPPLEAEGYEIVHISDGYMLYKQGVYVRQMYFILRRAQSLPSAKPFEFEPVQ